MARLAAGDLFVRRVLLHASGVAWVNLFHALYDFEDGFGAPEAAACKRRRLQFLIQRFAHEIPPFTTRILVLAFIDLWLFDYNH